MKTFCDYLQEQKTFLAKYNQPDYFMSFTEAKWTVNDENTPNGILLFPVAETMHLWKDGRFSLYDGPQEKLYIFKIADCIGEYTLSSFTQDVEQLLKLYEDKFEPNQKLIDDYTERAKTSDTPWLYEAMIDKENEKFNHMIEEVTDSIAKPSKKLWEITKWIANNGKDPKIKFTGNAPQRWTNVFQNLGYKGFVFESVAIFFSTQDLEKIAEIKL